MYNQVLHVLSRVYSKKHNKSILELGMVKEVSVQERSIRVLLKPAQDCLCPYSFILAARAEAELRKIPGVEDVVVEVELD